MSVPEAPVSTGIRAVAMIHTKLKTIGDNESLPPSNIKISKQLVVKSEDYN